MRASREHPAFHSPLIDAARRCRRTVSGRWFVDKTYVKVAARRRLVYIAIDDQDVVNLEVPITVAL